MKYLSEETNQLISNLAYEGIRRWKSVYNRSFISPTAVQKANLTRLLLENTILIDFSVRRLIEIMVKNN